MCVYIYSLFCTIIHNKEETTCRQSDIPSVVDVSEYEKIERKEIKDMLAYLKLANSQNDDLSFERIINLPRRGIGEQSIKIIIDYARSSNLSFFDSLKDLAQSNKLSPSLLSKTQPFLDLINKISDLISKTSLEDLGIFVIEESGYLKMLENEKNKLKQIENESRIDNLKELVNALSEFENLDDFLETCGNC